MSQTAKRIYNIYCSAIQFLVDFGWNHRYGRLFTVICSPMCEKYGHFDHSGLFELSLLLYIQFGGVWGFEKNAAFSCFKNSQPPHRITVENEVFKVR